MLKRHYPSHQRGTESLCARLQGEWNVGVGRRRTRARTGEKIGALDFVSHCYHRPRHLPVWPYNLFAMVHGRDRDEVEAKVRTIADLLGTADRGHTVLYSTRILKKTGLRLGG
jgi:DNA-binding Lrp family transcriptional regulator